jgi:hypothetical protein
MPSWETIRRSRQSLQAENPDLRADEEIQRLRDKRQEEFKEYFKNDNSNKTTVESGIYLRPRNTVEVINSRK